MKYGVKYLIKYLLAILFLCLAADLAYQAAFAGENGIFAMASTNGLNYLGAALLAVDAVGVLLGKRWVLASWCASLVLYAGVALGEYLIPIGPSAARVFGRHPWMATSFFSYWILPFLVGLGIFFYLRAVSDPQAERGIASGTR